MIKIKKFANIKAYGDRIFAIREWKCDYGWVGTARIPGQVPQSREGKSEARNSFLWIYLG